MAQRCWFWIHAPRCAHPRTPFSQEQQSSGSGLKLRSKARTLVGLVTDPTKLHKLFFDGSKNGQAIGDESSAHSTRGLSLYLSLLSSPASLIFNGSMEMISVEYVWTDGPALRLPSKAMIVPGPITHPNMLPTWSYHGPITDQAIGHITLKPQAIYKDPLRMGNNIMAVATNTRNCADKIFSNPDVAADLPRYIVEGKYTLQQNDAFVSELMGRSIVDSHYSSCLYAGINICCTESTDEYTPGQYSFTVGPTIGIAAADEACMARYILERIAETAGVAISFEGTWPLNDPYIQISMVPEGFDV